VRLGGITRPPDARVDKVGRKLACTPPDQAIHPKDGPEYWGSALIRRVQYSSGSRLQSGRSRQI